MKGFAKINNLIENLDYKFIGKVMLSSLIIGILAHGFMIFNKFTWNDDTVSTFGAGCTNELGRWSLEILRRWEYYLFEGSLSMSQYNGIGTFACVAIAGILIMKLTDLTSVKDIILITGVMVTTPTIMGFFTYMFTALFYSIGLVIATVGVCVFYKKKNAITFIASAFLIAFGTGIYQAWFAYSLALIVFLMLIKYLKKESAWKEYWGDCLSNLFMCLVALLMYLGINEYYLKKYDLQMIEHANMNTMGIVSFGEYIQRIGRAYKLFFRPERSFYPALVSKVYKGMLLLCVIVFVIYIKKYAASKKQILQNVILIGIFPVSVCSIIVMAGDGYSLMLYPYIFPYLLLIWLITNLGDDNEKIKLLKKLSVFVVAFMILWLARYSNASYQKAYMIQTRANTYFTNLIGRIQGTEGYSEDLPIAYLDPLGVSKDTIEITTELEKYGTPDTYITYYSWESYMRLYCGFNQEYFNDEEIEAFVSKHSEISSMSCYPDDGSIKVIDGVIVVKFTEKYDE